MRTLLLTLALLSMTLLPAVPADGALAGAYAGTGPSRYEGRSGGHCTDAHVAFYGPTGTRGTWAMEITSIHLPLMACEAVGVGISAWPSHVADNLEGSPETGFAASGVAWRHDGDPAGPTVIFWRLDVSPLGAGTTWSLALVGEQPSGDVRHGWWNGTADVFGAHV